MRVIINGAAGAMGRELHKLLDLGEQNGSVAALVDVQGGEGIDTDFSQIDAPADVVIDFSFHTATGNAVAYALAHKLPLVVGTTGHTPLEQEEILNAAKEIPVFYTGNMSLGIAVLCKLTQDALRFFPQADVEILEVHHNRKADAPSGTALMLAKAVQAVRPNATIHCGRSGQCKRTKEEIGISSLRLGNVVGIHEVHISTGTQSLTLKHEAHDRSLFAQGALQAASFLLGRAPGRYDMEQLVSQ